MLACIVICPLVDSVKAVSTFTWLAVVHFAIDPWLMSSWAMMANAFVFGNAFSLSSIFIDVVIKKVFGEEQMGHAM